MEVLSAQLLNGLTAGAEYAMVAAGLALIFGVLGVLNFAQAELYMIAAYATFIIEVQLQLPYLVAVALAVAIMVGVGVLFYKLVLERVMTRGWQAQLVATLAVSILLVNFATVTSGPVARLISSPLVAISVPILGSHVSVQRLFVMGVAALVFTGLYLVLSRTRIGKAMRAMAQNPEAAAVVGIPIGEVGLVAVVLASALCGVAAATIAPLYTVSPTMGKLVLAKAFAAVIVGGFGSVWGAVIAAIGIGLLEALVIGYVTSEYANLVVYGVMILVLLFRPQGLLGKVVRV